MHASSHRHRARAEIDELALRLVGEYSERLAAGVVIAWVARCREELLRAGATSNLVGDTEARVREELNVRIPPHSGVSPGL
jgi:hypothetical protein